MSPRIAWFNCLSVLKLAGKIAIAIGLLLGAAYGIRQAIEQTFHQNPDFRLQAIQLNENDVLDESDLVDQLGIDLSSNIFDFNVTYLENELLKIPAISTAEVKRELPGTLNFHLTTRKPIAWVACPEENFAASRVSGGLLVDHTGYLFPCPPRLVQTSAHLPILLLTPEENFPIQAGRIIEHPQYKHCLHLLTAILAHNPESLSSVSSISQKNEWSLNLSTRSGIEATFGLGDHKRQLDNLQAALHHSEKKGYQIETINLIPKRNVPITVREDNLPPRAIPVAENTPTPAPRENRQAQDLHSLLNRN